MKCRSCGTELPARAMFCGECGFTVTVPKLVEPPRRNRVSDTAVIAPLPPVSASDAPAVSPRSSAAPAHRASAPVGAPEPLLDEPGPERPIELIPAFPVHEAPGASAAFPEKLRPRRAAEPVERPEHSFEDTRVVHRAPGGERFVLQFSTGESTTVFGSGLVGRNPVAQPGESFDQIVTIADPSKSVSKTHLEFGQTNGTFWVCDRFSGNGTVVRQPDERPQRLQPGRRHVVARGTRIDIAEQFFIVS